MPFEQFFVLVTALGTSFLSLKPLIEFLSDCMKKRSCKKIISVVGCVVPSILQEYPDFTSFRKAINSDSAVVIVHTENLKKAIKRSDFVVTTRGASHKIIHPDETERLKSIL